MLHIQLFDHLELTWQGQPLLVPGKATTLLAYLLLNRHAPLRRDTLAYTLWPDSSELAARTNLRRSLHQLRASLPPAEDWLLTTPDTVQWNVSSNCHLDVAEFEQLAHDPTRLAEAVALYRGDLLADSEADWLFYERERLRSLYEASLERLVNDSRQQRNYAAASHYAAQLLARDPLHEQMTRHLMASYYEAGDRAAALATYRQFASRLMVELAAEPMTETTALYEAVLAAAPLPTFAAATPLPVAGPLLAGLPFVGRAAELGQLTAGWQQAAAGRGTLYFVGGEAGVGKTRLCAELSAVVAGQGGWLLHGSTAEGEARPYQAVAEALREALPLLRASNVAAPTLRALLPLLPELAVSDQLAPLPTLEPERERSRLYQAISDCLHTLSAQRPLLLLLEDLHWAGQASVSLLHYVAERLAGSAILLVVTYREEEALRDHPLRELRRTLASSSQQLALERLSGAAVGELAARLPGQPVAAELAAAWYRVSEGNPFFLGELIYGWLAGEVVDKLPERVQQLLARRIAPLPANTRLVAEVASVIGVSFSPELVGEAAGLSEGQVLGALDQLIDQRLVREAVGGHSFSHQLIRETVYAGIDPDSRQRRHRRIGLLLDEAEGEQQAAAIAAHFAAGGEGQRAQDWYLKAAQQALSVYADEEALAAADRALLLGSDPHRRFELLALQEAVYHRLGQREPQQAVLEQMTAIVEELQDDDLICEVLRRQIQLCDVTDQLEQQAQLVTSLLARAESSDNQHWQAVGREAQALHAEKGGRFEPAEAYLEQAIALYQQLADCEGEVRCLCRQSNIATFQGHFSTVNTLLERAQTLASDDNRSMIVEMLRLAAVNLAMQDDYLASYELSSQMLTFSRAIHDRRAEATAQGILALNSANLNHPPQTFAHAAAAQTLFEEVGDESGLAQLHGVLGVLHGAMGRLQDALVAFEQARTIFSRLGNDRAQTGCLINLSNYAADAEQYQQAKEYAEAGLKLAKTLNSPVFDSYLLNCLGIAELYLGGSAAAVEHLHASVVACRRSEPVLAELLLQCLAYLALAQLQLGARDDAAQTSAELLTMQQQHADQATLAHYYYWAAACVERVGGNGAAARQHLLNAHHELRQAQAAKAEKLGEWADEQWRSSFVDLPLNRAIIAAYERDEWPAYAQPPGPVEPALPLCPACGRNRAVIRSGQATAGGQRYRCTDCQRYFTVERKGKGHDPALHARAHDLHRQGWSSRQIARELGVSHVAVSKWLKDDPG